MIGNIKFLSMDVNSLAVDKREALRYLGATKSDETIDAMYEEGLVHVKSMSEPRASYVRVKIDVGEDTVDFGFMTVKSCDLAKNLKDCAEAFVFCATLGIGVDRYFERLTRVSQAKAAVYSAVASAAVESFCDYVNDTLKEGVLTRPRFSCGYGDFCIEHQSDILEALGASKHLGICLTDSFMMVPVKTVTAIIGIRR